MLSPVIALCLIAHALATAPPIAPSASSSVARRRIGTSTNHTARPTTPAISAPREYDSISTVMSSAIAGTESALAKRLASGRAPAHTQAGRPSAAISPVAFQYENGTCRRPRWSCALIVAGNTLASSA